MEEFDSEIVDPILHVVTYKDKDLDELMAEFATKEYDLTLGGHSRLEGFAGRIIKILLAGNIYINRIVISGGVGGGNLSEV